MFFISSIYAAAFFAKSFLLLCLPFSPAAVADVASKMLGARLVTKQTGAEGRPCNQVLITERLYLRRETYFSLMLERTTQGPVLVVSPAGGMNIEEVAAATPEAILKVPVDIMKGLQPEQVQQVVAFLGFNNKSAESVRLRHSTIRRKKRTSLFPSFILMHCFLYLSLLQASELVRNLYRLFCDTDCTLVEINPLAETPDGKVYCMDAKFNFDDNADFRHEDIFKLRYVLP